MNRTLQRDVVLGAIGLVCMALYVAAMLAAVR